GISMHPPISPARFAWADHPLAGEDPLEAVDERYSYMQSFGERDVVATHEHDGIDHPVVWTRSHGPSRVAVDLLGHDARSYASPSHRALIARLARWAARGGGAGRLVSDAARRGAAVSRTACRGCAGGRRATARRCRRRRRPSGWATSTGA